MKAWGCLWLSNDIEINLDGNELTLDEKDLLRNNEIVSIGEHEIGEEANVYIEGMKYPLTDKEQIKELLLK